MKKYLIVILFFILCASGCEKKYSITPNELPIAQVNKNYNETINIDGGKVFDDNAILIIDIPENLGVTIQKKDESYGYNIIEIKGTPKYKGSFSIKIRVGFFGGGDARIDKTYTFTVTK